MGSMWRTGTGEVSLCNREVQVWEKGVCILAQVSWEKKQVNLIKHADPGAKGLFSEAGGP